jgi:hypothetical protein
VRIEPFIFVGILACAGNAVAAPSAAGNIVGKFYCCADAAGKYICGDTLPMACYGRAYRELGANGRTLRIIEAPLNAEQRAQRAAEEEQRRQDDVRLKEQQRKDQILLDTYVSADEIEVLRKRALDDVRQSIRGAEARIAEIQALRKKHENEAEFYKNRDLPPDIQKGLADTEFEIKAQESIIEAREKEKEAIQARFDEDHKRFLDLQHRKPVTPR